MIQSFDEAVMERDAKQINIIVKKYGGEEGAHFGFIAKGTARRYFMGGNSLSIGLMIAEALANIVNETEGLDSKYIEAIAKTALEMYADMGDEPPMVQ